MHVPKRPPAPIVLGAERVARENPYAPAPPEPATSEWGAAAGAMLLNARGVMPDGVIWYYTRTDSGIDYGYQLQIGFGVSPSFTLRPSLVDTPSLQLGLDLEISILAADLGLPIGVNLLGNVWLFTEPAMWVIPTTKDFIALGRLPIGVTMPLNETTYLALEGGAMLTCGGGLLDSAETGCNWRALPYVNVGFGFR